MKTMKRQVASIAVACGLSILTAPTASAFKQGGVQTPFGVSTPELPSIPPNHQLITEDGLRSGEFRKLPNWKEITFSSSAQGDIMLANARVDADSFDEPTFHFDADNFEKSSEHLRSWLGLTAAYAVKGDVTQARELFGLALHLLQDFYAHSNFVEIKALDSKLERPKFGTARPFDGIGLTVERSPTNLAGAACTKGIVLASAPLTTGFYDAGQSGPDFPTVSGLGQIAAIAWLEKYTKINPLLVLLQDQTSALGFYTDEWSSLRVAYGDTAWPSDRCVHGGDEGPGINHDKQGRHNYDSARLEAVKATREYFDRLFDRMVEEASKGDGPNRYRGICKFFGVEESKCDLAGVKIDSLTPTAKVVRQGEWVGVTVTGENIPTTAVVVVDDASPCGLKSEASATGFTMLCRLGGSPGVKTVSIRLTATGEPQTLTATVTLAPAGLITFLPAELSGDSISSWSIGDVASWVKQVVWKFGSDAADVVANISNGTIEAAKTLLTLPGVREVVATLSNGYGDEGVTLKVAVNVSQGATVSSFEAVGPVIAGQPATFLLKGTKLPLGLVVNIQDCGIAAEAAEGGLETQRPFACTFPVSAIAGPKGVGVGPAGSIGSPFENALANGLKINLVKSTVTQVTASPTPGAGAASTVTVIGAYLPTTAAVLVDDANCDRSTVAAKGDGTGFAQTCTFGPTAGTKGVIVLSASDASGFVIDDTKTLTVGAAQPPSYALFDEFSGIAVDATRWTIDGWDGTGNTYATWSGTRVGPVVVNNGVAEFGKAGRISTKGKVTFSGDGTIVVEGRMAGSGTSRDTSLMLVDSTTGDQILMGDTDYAGWGFYAIGMGGYKLKEASTIGDPTNPLTLSGSTAAFMEYRVTLSGDKIKIERGPTLANITQTGTATLGQPIVGRTFHLSIGTAWAYYPGTWDWVRVSGQATVVNAGARPTMVADTGVPSCADYAFSPFSLDHTVGLDCALSQDSRGDPVPPRQDGATGRDALAARGLLAKIGSGPGGFDFTKLDASGAALPASATSWACVRDNHTKLVWENKASDGGLRDYRHRYTWYSTAADSNGGNAGSLGSNTCGGTLGAACNTQAYVAALNAAQLCGGSSWRLPKLEELRSIVNFGRVNPSIDTAWFSNTDFIPSVPFGIALGFWSSNLYSANPTLGVMGMEFSYGLLMTPGKSNLLAARAVMSDK